MMESYYGNRCTTVCSSKEKAFKEGKKSCVKLKAKNTYIQKDTDLTKKIKKKQLKAKFLSFTVERLQ